MKKKQRILLILLSFKGFPRSWLQLRNMALLGLCLVFLIIFSSSTLLNADKIPKFYPQGYHLDLFPDLNTNLLKGLVSINIATYAEPSNVIELDADPSMIIHYKSIRVFELRKDNVKSNTSHVIPRFAVETVERVLYDDGTLRIHLSQKLQRDITYQLHINFETHFKNESIGQPFFIRKFFDATSRAERKFIIMDLTENGCHKAFPCFNKLDYKCWISLVVTHKPNFYALSTAPVNYTTREINDSSLVKDHFLTTPPMSMNSLALIVSDYRMINTLKFMRPYDETNGVSDGNNKEITHVMKVILRRVEERLGIPFPLPLFHVVIVPTSANIPYINAFGLLLINSTNIDEDHLVSNLVFDACCQWFLHVTSPITRNYAAHAIISHLKNSIAEEVIENADINLLPRIDSGQSKFLDLLQTPKRFLEVLSLNSDKVFEKFSFNMLDRVFPNLVGEAMYKFLQKKQFKLYTDADLWSSLNEIGTERNICRNSMETYNVYDIVESWKNTDYVPLLTVTRDYLKNQLNITQEPLVYAPTMQEISHLKNTILFHAPLVPLVISRSDTLFQGNHFFSWLSNASEVFEYDSTTNSDLDFFVLNPGHLAPCVVNYDEPNWRMLTEHFHSLPANIQLQLLIDSLVLAKTGILNYSIFLNMSAKLPVDQKRLELWSHYSYLVANLSNKLYGMVAKKYKEFILRQANMFYTKTSDIRIEKNVHFVKKLISETRYRFDCLINRSFCFTPIEYERLIYEVTTNRRLTGKHNCEVIKNVSLTNWYAIATGLFHASYNFPSQERSHLLYILSCTEHPVAFETYMNLLLLNFNKSSLMLTTSDQIHVITHMDNVHLQMLLHFVDKNFYLLKERLNSQTWKLLLDNVIKSARLDNEIQQVVHFSETYNGQFGTAEEIVKKAVHTVLMEVQVENQRFELVQDLLDKIMTDFNILS